MSVSRPVLSPYALSGFLGHMVRTISPVSEADPVGILGTALSAFSAAVGRNPRVRAGYMSQPLPVWVVLCGVTGIGRKGTATGNTMTVMRAALSDWAERAVLEGCPQSGPALVSTLADMGGSALMIEEEFADLLKVSARYKNFGKAIRRTWEGATISNVTKEAAIVVESPHVAIIGNVTPVEFLGSIGKSDRAGGTLNRFIPLYVNRSKVIGLGEQISAEEWQALIRPLAQQMRAAVAFAREVDDVTPSREVVALWDGGMRAAVEKLTLGNEAMEQFAARATDYVWRIAALYALADRREVIAPADLRAAGAVVEYMAQTVAYLSPDASTGGNLAVQVESFIQQAGPDGLKATEIYRRFNLKRADLETIVAGLDTIEVTKGVSVGGRPPVIYRYVPPADMAGMIEETPEVAPAVMAETSPAPSVRENGDVQQARPDELAALEAVMYGKPEPTEAAPNVASAVRDLRALLDGANAPAEPQDDAQQAPEPTQDAPAVPMGVDALRAMLDAANAPAEPVQEALTLVQPVEVANDHQDDAQDDTDDDDDLSDILSACTWARVA